MIKKYIKKYEKAREASLERALRRERRLAKRLRKRTKHQDKINIKKKQLAILVEQRRAPMKKQFEKVKGYASKALSAAGKMSSTIGDTKTKKRKGKNPMDEFFESF